VNEFYVLRSPFNYVRFKLRSLFKGSKLGRTWVEDHSPLLMELRKTVQMEQWFDGVQIGVCLPGTWESFVFLSVLEAGGAKLHYYPMFCKPEVGVELLRSDSIKLFNRRNLEKCVVGSDFVYDSTALFGSIVVEQRFPVKGIIEQTASGVSIYRDFESKSLLHQPVLNLDGSYVKRVGENKLATGLGLVEALLRLHLFLPDKEVLILGFGSVGSGCAAYLERVGCKITIFDVDKDSMVAAENSGYKAGTLEELLPSADIIVNATGSSEPVLKIHEFELLKTGAVLANMGGCGWDRTYFQGKEVQKVGDWVAKVFIDDRSFFYELAQGLPVNFIFASGTDTETMDMVFSLSAYALEYLIENHGSLPNRLLSIPEEIQKRHLVQVAELSARKKFAACIPV